MNRAKLYQEIRSLGLEKECKVRYGRNYTQVDNIKLESLIKEAVKPLKATPKKEDRLEKLIIVLKNKHILLDSEIAFIEGKTY